MAKPVMYRLGIASQPAGTLERSSCCHDPPTFVMRPRLNPVSETYPGQHGPHHAPYPWPPLTARAEIECPAPVSNTSDQSVALVPKPLLDFHRNSPPA